MILTMGRRSKQKLKLPLYNCRCRRIQYLIFIVMLTILIIIIFTMYQLYASQADDASITQYQSPINNVDKTQGIPKTNVVTTGKPTFKTTKEPTRSPTIKLTDKPTNNPTNLHYVNKESWIVNWTLANSIHNLTSENVSQSVIWKNENYNGYCGTQLYPILSNGDGLEYVWVHDVMSIEMGTKVWIFATDPSAVFERPIQPKLWLGIYNSYFICAFNDGTTVISEEIKFMRRKNLDFLIIICDIPPLLQLRVLSSNMNTSIGVSLFDSRNRSLNIIDNKEWKNVTIPVCSTFVINRGKHIYQSDGTKFSNIIKSANPILEPKQHKLSACLIVHPNGDYYNQMNVRIVEWIEYGLIMGFSHFYIYDHISPNDKTRENGDKFIWDAIYYYIKHGGKVTYIEWPFPYSNPWIFQYSFINSCLARFKYDNDYISIIDVDEYLIPPKRFITVLDVINHINSVKNRHANMFVLKCKLATTCPEKLGCGDIINKNNDEEEEDGDNNNSKQYKGYFDSFLERHGCISNDNPPTNPKKYIINPMAHWYAFVHGIPRWKENVDNVAEVFTEVGICLHARDHHKAYSYYHNESVDHVIDYLNYAWKHDVKIHPLFDQNRQFCPRNAFQASS